MFVHSPWVKVLYSYHIHISLNSREGLSNSFLDFKSAWIIDVCFLGILPLLIGVYLFLLDLTTSAPLPLTETHTVMYDDLNSCLSFGELDIAVDLNLTYPQIKQIKEFRAEFRLPDDVYQAWCDSKTTNLTVISKDGLLELHMILKLQDDDKNYAGLTVTDLQVHPMESISQTEADVPLILSKRGGSQTNKTLSYKSENSFNETVACSTKEQKVIFHSPRAQAAIVFSQVRLQPYSKFVRLDNGKGIICPHDLHSGDHDTAHSEIYIPLILAVALTVVILLIVIGYFVHKKIEGMGYTSME